jgi:hypothetical protein
MRAFRLASKARSSTTLLGRRLLIAQQEQRQNLWTVSTEGRQGFQLSPQNVQAHPEMASQVFRRMSMEVRTKRVVYHSHGVALRHVLASLVYI